MSADEVGAICSRDKSCADGQRCNKSYDVPRCTLMSAPGEACIVDADCPDEFICRGDDSACAICIPASQVGEDCAIDEDCAGELLCINTTSPGTCSEPLGFDELCSERGECDRDYTCNEGLEPPRCQIPFRQEAGEACSVHWQCRLDLICNQAFDPPQCALPGDVGAVCAGERDCELDLVCDLMASPPQCVEEGTEGRNCFANEECPDGSICHHTREPYWSCAPPSQPGEACAWDFDCVDALICIEGACVAPKLEGEACDYPFECERPPLRCAPGSPPDCVPPRMVCNQAERVCTMQRERGGHCASWTDCQNGLICNTAMSPTQCQSPGDPGTLCSDDSHCAEGLACAQGVCAAKICP